jgi:hypothetical protein
MFSTGVSKNGDTETQHGLCPSEQRVSYSHGECLRATLVRTERHAYAHCNNIGKQAGLKAGGLVKRPFGSHQDDECGCGRYKMHACIQVVFVSTTNGTPRGLIPCHDTQLGRRAQMGRMRTAGVRRLARHGDAGGGGVHDHARTCITGSGLPRTPAPTAHPAPRRAKTSWEDLVSTASDTPDRTNPLMKEHRGSELLSTARARGCWPCVKAHVDEWARTERVGAAAHVEERVERAWGWVAHRAGRVGVNVRGRDRVFPHMFLVRSSGVVHRST